MSILAEQLLAFQATISYGQKPNEAFLLHYGFVDTSYKADFYSTDLLEHVQQRYNIPEERVAGLAQEERLYKSVESVSVASPSVQGCFKSLSSCSLVVFSVYRFCVCQVYLYVSVNRQKTKERKDGQKQIKKWQNFKWMPCFWRHITASNTSRSRRASIRAQMDDWMWVDRIHCSQSFGCLFLTISSIFPAFLKGIHRLRQAYKRSPTNSILFPPEWYESNDQFLKTALFSRPQ